MNKTQVITLRVPAELRNRLADAAHTQGVSLNNLANYLLTTQLSQLEFFMRLEQRLAQKNLPELTHKVQAILESVPVRETTPDWDRLINPVK